MRTYLLRRISLLCAIGLSSGMAFGATLSLDQAPGPVKRTAQTELKNGTIREIQTLDQNGRTIYQVTFQNPSGGSKVIYLNADGTYVNSQNSKPATTLTRQQVPLNQLPPPVQRTIRTETKNGPVARVEQLPNNNGQSMYEVFFTEANGKEKVIYLNPDGTYVKSGSASVGTVGNSASVSSSGQGTSSWDSMAGGGRVPLSGATKVTYAQLPEPVQHAFQNVAGTAPIESVDRGTLNGQTVYEGAFKQNGQTVKLRVTPRGTVIQDPRDSRILAGAPMLNARAIGLSQLPAPAQNAIQAQVGTGRVESVQQGQMDGQTVYEALVNRNGQNERVRVSSAGRVLSVSQALSSFDTLQR